MRAKLTEFVFTVIVTLAVFASGNVLAAEYTRIVKVTGEAELPGEPVFATMTIGVSISDKSTTTALALVNKRLDSIRNALRKQGIGPESIATKTLTLTPKTNYSTNEINGYTIEHELSVELRDISKLGVVFDTALEAGASSIDGINYVVKDRESIQERALQLAVQDARRKAGVLVGVAGANLEIKTIEDKSPSSTQDTFGGWNLFAPQRVTEVSLQSIPIRASVIVEFSF